MYETRHIQLRDGSEVTVVEMPPRRCWFIRSWSRDSYQGEADLSRLRAQTGGQAEMTDVGFLFTTATFRLPEHWVGRTFDSFVEVELFVRGEVER